MFGSELRAWILSLEKAGAVTFVRSLLIAEASRLGADLQTVRMSGIVDARDEGIDGWTDLPDDSDSIFPMGPKVWQVKSGSSKTPSVDTEVGKPGVLRAFDEGRDYVLVWTQDPPSRAALESKLLRAVTAVNPERVGVLLTVEDLERLALIHPAVVQSLGGPPLLGLPMNQWGRHLEAEAFPFVSDGPRQEQLEQLRKFATDSSPSLAHLHIFGDTGVGKSRLVYEALDSDELRDRAFVCVDYNHVDQGRLGSLVMTEEAHATLVVDDCSLDDAARLATFSSATKGRIRLVTIGDRPSREALAGTTSLDVVPLQEGVIAGLVQRVAALSDQEAETIAHLAEGFPKLAIELARILGDQREKRSIAELLMTLTVSDMLNRMIPDASVREDITVLAVVDRLGFDKELAFETDELCRAFGLSAGRFRASVARETGRFVAQAGRYRRATPKALAIWLVRELIRQAPEEFAGRVAQLPEELFEAFRRQMEILGGDPETNEALKEVLARRADWFRGPNGPTEKGARLLHALAFAVPEMAAEEISLIVRSKESSDLRQLDGDRRRELVWALEHLRWFRSTFFKAADAILALASEETESYANNATGILNGIFAVHLGGTEVPFLERLAWLRESFPRYGQAGAELAVEAASSALETHEFRSGGWRGARLQPEEWRPRSYEEEREARLAALEFLLSVRNDYPGVEGKVASIIANRFRALATRGLGMETLETLRTFERSADTKARISSGFREALAYDNPPEPLRSAIEEALTRLQGSSLSEQIDVTLATDYWDLTTDTEEKLQGPPILDELAQRILTESPDLGVEVAHSDNGNPITRFELFRQLGRLDSGGQLEGLAQDEEASSEARTGYVIGHASQEQEAWAEEVMRGWLERPRLAGDVPMVVHSLPANRDRVQLAIHAVAEQGVPLNALNRLMLGSWVKPLDAETVALILDQYVQRELDLAELDAAMHLLYFWLLEPEHEASPRLAELGSDLLRRAAKAGGRHGGGPAWMRERLAPLLPLTDEDRLNLLLESLQAKDFPTEDEVTALAELAAKNPERVISAVIELILSDTEGWTLYLERANLLSRIAERVGSDNVVPVVSGRSHEEQERLLRHLDWTREEPDPVFTQLLLELEDADFLASANERFLFPGEVVVGSYAEYLKRRRETLMNWASDDHPEQLRAWASGLIPSLDRYIEREQLRESEGIR
jgi:hypothetical protein